MSEVHTYPDGSQRVGEPPFPKLSPLEQAQGKTAEPEPKAVSVDVEAPKRGRKPKAE